MSVLFWSTVTHWISVELPDMSSVALIYILIYFRISLYPISRCLSYKEKDPGYHIRKPLCKQELKYTHIILIQRIRCKKKYSKIFRTKVHSKIKEVKFESFLREVIPVKTMKKYILSSSSLHHTHIFSGVAQWHKVGGTQMFPKKSEKQQKKMGRKWE